MKILIVVDMQKDFVNGALGSAEAIDIVPNIAERIKEYEDKKGTIFFTRDTHFDNYFDTLEGKMLPVKHCIQGTDGWHIIPELRTPNYSIVNKITFGYNQWDELFKPFGMGSNDSIELCGVCTDICVISNALILRALYPNTPIIVHANCCAGVTPEKHEAALKVMESCQIDVIRD